jgi:hypothetical protein
VVGGGLEGWRRTISGLDLLRIFRRDRKTGRIGVWRNDGLMFEAREGINLEKGNCEEGFFFGKL